MEVQPGIACLITIPLAFAQNNTPAAVPGECPAGHVNVRQAYRLGLPAPSLSPLKSGSIGLGRTQMTAWLKSGRYETFGGQITLMLAGQAVPNWQLNTTSYDAGRWYVRRMLYPLTSSMLNTEREFDKIRQRWPYGVAGASRAAPSVTSTRRQWRPGHGGRQLRGDWLTAAVFPLWGPRPWPLGMTASRSAPDAVAYCEQGQREQHRADSSGDYGYPGSGGRQRLVCAAEDK